MKDMQKQRVYDAETVVAAVKQPLPSQAQVESFVGNVCRMREVSNRFGMQACGRQITIKVDRHRRRAQASAWSIKLDGRDHTMNTWMVVHELAHVLHARLPRSDAWYGGASHGWQFCAAYLFLVQVVFGQDIHDKLARSFKEHRVRFKPPRVLSPEQRQRLVAIGTAALAARRKAALDATRKDMRLPPLAAGAEPDDWPADPGGWSW